MAETGIPTFDRLVDPVIQALKALGGSGTIEEINHKAAETAGLSDEELDVLHDPDRAAQTEVEYRLAWSRTYLKKCGVVENSCRGVWALTTKGRQLDQMNPTAVRRFVRDQNRKAQAAAKAPEVDEADAETGWWDELMSLLLDTKPSAFERLAQRLLCGAGFFQVEVTGCNGNGGIDGKGICASADCSAFM